MYREDDTVDLTDVESRAIFVTLPVDVWNALEKAQEDAGENYMGADELITLSVMQALAYDQVIKNIDDDVIRGAIINASERLMHDIRKSMRD